MSLRCLKLATIPFDLGNDMACPLVPPLGQMLHYIDEQGYNNNIKLPVCLFMRLQTSVFRIMWDCWPKAPQAAE